MSILSRYSTTVLVTRTETRIKWDVIAQDIHQSIRNRIISPIQRRLNCIHHCVAAVAVSAVVGVVVAAATYRELIG